MQFHDRSDAGRRLALKLAMFADRPDVVVLGLPRGGIPVAYEIARALRAPLDVFVVRKLGLPGEPELAMGAIAPGGIRVLQHDLVDLLAIPSAVIEEVTAREEAELERRERAYRGDRPPVDVEERVVIVVDDGLATGSTMRAAMRTLFRLGAEDVVVAVPVASRAAVERISQEADDVVCLAMPEPFVAIGAWYERFDQTTDDEVRELLEAAREDRAAGSARGLEGIGRS